MPTTKNIKNGEISAKLTMSTDEELAEMIVKQVKQSIEDLVGYKNRACPKCGNKGTLYPQYEDTHPLSGKIRMSTTTKCNHSEPTAPGEPGHQKLCDWSGDLKDILNEEEYKMLSSHLTKYV